jgi:hypothetical protein
VDIVCSRINNALATDTGMSLRLSPPVDTTQRCTSHPRFDFDDHTGRPIKRLGSVLRNATRTSTLLSFLETTRVSFGPFPEGPRG